MICEHFIRMFTPRNVIVLLLLLEVSFSFVIADNSNQESRPKKQKNNPKSPNSPRKCRVVDIANGDSVLFNQRKRLRYTCDEDYQIFGRDTSTCTENGKWLHPPPVCVARGCPQIPATENGPLKIKSIDLYKGAVLRFSCSSGFNLSGPLTILCNKTHWNNNPPKCIATVAVEEVPTTYLPPAEEVTTHVKSVQTTTSSYPAVDESLTSAHDEIPLSAEVEKTTTSPAPRIIIVSVATKLPSLPMSTRVASSIAELDLPISATTKAELQSVDSGDLTFHPTLKADESTTPLSVQTFGSFPDDVMDSDSVRSNTSGRITHSFSGELTEAQTTSTSEMLHQDKETKRPDMRATETHELFPEKPLEVDEEVSTSDAYQTTSQKPLKTAESSEMVPESEKPDDKTPETPTFSSATVFKMEEHSEDGEAGIQSPTSESVSAYSAATQELLTGQLNSSRIKVPIDDAETRTTSEQSLIFSFSSSLTGESDDVKVPFEHDSTGTESDAAKSLRSLIVTHLFKEYPQTTTPQSSISANNLGSDETSTKTQTESSSDETIVLRTEKMAAEGNKTGKPQSHSVLTTHVPPSNLAGYKSAPTFDSSTMTTEDHVSVVLIVVIVAAVIVLVVLLSILGKVLKPKCTRPKPGHENGAVPYTEQVDQDQVVLTDVTPVHDINRCTQV